MIGFLILLGGLIAGLFVAALRWSLGVLAGWSPLTDEQAGAIMVITLCGVALAGGIMALWVVARG